jgi:hypothetical protein
MTWLKTNWKTLGFSLFLVIVAATMIAQGYAALRLAQPAPTMRVEKGAPTATATPKILNFTPDGKIWTAYPLPTVAYPLPTPLGQGSGMFAAAVATPVWVQRGESFNAALYGKVLQLGVQSVSAALLDASPAHKVGTTMGLGWPESNPFEVCTSADGCATCIKYDQGAVCYVAGKNNYSFLSPPGWHYGDVVSGKITAAPAPTPLGGATMPPGTPIR